MKPLMLAAALVAALVTPRSARAGGPILLDEKALAAHLVDQVAAQYDSTAGGWVARDGRPLESAVDLAFALARAGRAEPWRARALATVEWTWTLADTLGGGFTWRVTRAPGRDAIEKRTVPNARRLENLLDAWAATGDTPLRRRIARTADFMERVLVDGRGGFVTAQVGDRELAGEPNGVAIRAWLRWAAAERRSNARDFALKSLDRVRGACWDSTIGMLRRGTFGELVAAPQLADQVEMGRAYVLAAHLCGRAADLGMARAVADRMLAAFEDPEKGGFRTQAMPDKQGRIKRAARVPAENARAALFLAEVASVTGEPRYREAARRTIAAFAKEHQKPQPESADWALAARAILAPDLPARVAWAEPAKRPAARPTVTRIAPTRGVVSSEAGKRR
jgi:uncharacterized protein YyaL (SSP411 family)